MIDHINFPGSYWSNNLMPVVGCLLFAISIIAGFVILVISIVFWFFGLGTISVIILSITSVVAAFIYYIFKLLKNEDKVSCFYSEIVLDTYPDLKPKKIQFDTTNTDTQCNSFVYELDKIGKYKYQICLDGKIGIKIYNHDCMRLIIDCITPNQFIYWNNKYWQFLPIDSNAASLTIEGFAFPDSPRPHFYYTIYMSLSYDFNAEPFSKYFEPISSLFEKEEKVKNKPMWWPEGIELNEISIESHPAKYYPQLQEFSKYPFTEKINVYLNKNENELYLILSISPKWMR